MSGEKFLMKLQLDSLDKVINSLHAALEEYKIHARDFYETHVFRGLSIHMSYHGKCSKDIWKFLT